MKPKIYTIFGIIVIAISLILTFNWLSSTMRFNASIWVDGIWFMILGVLCSLVLGILLVLFGIGKFRINRLSNIAVKLLMAGLGISFIGVPSLMLYIKATNRDAMGMILAIPIIMLSCLLAINSLVVLIVAIFKDEKSQ